MSYTAKLADSDTTVTIVDKSYDGDTQVLIDEDGNTYTAIAYGEAALVPYEIAAGEAPAKDAEQVDEKQTSSSTISTDTEGATAAPKGK